MKKSKSKTKYEKKVIKSVGSVLKDIPFTCEITQKNHLKFLIDGVEKPLFTGLTPSDHKSLPNFISEVKKALKQRANNLAAPVQTEDGKKETSNTEKHEKLIRNMRKKLQQLKSLLMKEEKKLVLENKNVDFIAEHRLNLVKQAI